MSRSGPELAKPSESPGCEAPSDQVAALCLELRRKCPADLAGSNFHLSAPSISSQGHLARRPPVLLGKNW